MSGAGRAVVVLGTGTEVGKTWVTSALASALRVEGVTAAALKAVATGVDDGLGEDAHAHAAALGSAPRPPCFAFRRPVSPHLAARDEGREVDLAPIGEAVAALTRAHEIVLVETAGGVFSPLSLSATNADLARALAPARLVLVAPDRLGVLHDLRACLLAMRAVELAEPLVVMTSPGSPDASTGTNAAEVRALGMPAPVVTFTRGHWSDPAALAAAREVVRLLVT